MPKNIVFAPTPASAERTSYCDFMIIDEMLPCEFSPFRNLEYTHYLSYFDRSCLVSTEGWHGGTSNAGFDDHLAQSTLPPEVKDKIFDLSFFDAAVPKLAYITFLHNAWLIYPYLEQRNIPFILQLYPGGGFEINTAESDEKLRALAHSHLCRKIIATQTLTQRYLLDKIGCDPERIEFVYGGVYDTRVEFDFLRDKKLYGRDKETLDICFVAHRYGDDVRKKAMTSSWRLPARWRHATRTYAFMSSVTTRPASSLWQMLKKESHFMARSRITSSQRSTPRWTSSCQ